MCRRFMGNEFGVFLKQIREGRGMTLKELSEKSGVTQSYICRLENGLRRRPTSIVIEDLSEALEVNPFRLMGTDYGQKEAETIEMETLFLHQLSFNGTILDTIQKVILAEINLMVLSAKWNQETIPSEVQQLINKINQLKGAFQ